MTDPPSLGRLVTHADLMLRDPCYLGLNLLSKLLTPATVTTNR